MPSGSMAPDGSWSFGFDRNLPYSVTYSTLQFLPDLQVSGRITSIDGTQALSSQYGSDKDKAAGFKLRVLRANSFGLNWIPDVSIGMDDVQGNRLFRSRFIAATKEFRLGSFGTAEATIGYGQRRISGLYGGVRLRPAAYPAWALVAEYDRTNYRHDPFVANTGIGKRHTGALNLGLEYHWGPLQFQVSRQQDHTAFNVSYVIPLQKREFIPKTDVVGPFPGGAWASAAPRPTVAQWEDDDSYRENLLVALETEGLRNVRMAWRDGVMSLSVSGDRYRYPSRAIGRTARLALAYAPLETRKLEITWNVNGVAGITWTFFDIQTLERYFAGTATRSELAQAVTLSYANPHGLTAASRANDLNTTLDSLAAERVGNSQTLSLGTARYAIETPSQTSFGISPDVSVLLNDPSGFFKYDLGLRAFGRAHLAQSFWLEGAVRASLAEDISDAANRPSNSLLPHVRSDLALYSKATRVRVDRLLLNKFWQPATRFYVRGSAGLYEEMYGGAGAQALYLTPSGRWAYDIAVDALRQRNYKGTGFLNYSTVTAIGSIHYRLPWLEGVTATLRAGRFLAKDWGTRFELKRTFRSGIEIGVWYTHTNGNDITSPGSPSHPYNDKGVFVRIPLAPLLTHDTSAASSISISPWNRDVGQMVDSPADLYGMAEHGWLNNALDGDGLRGFGDVPGEDTP